MSGAQRQNRVKRSGYHNRIPKHYSYWLKSKTDLDIKRRYLQLIEEKYQEAQTLSAQTGIPHDIDHIIPLKGKDVSGLHVPENLQVVPASRNRSKQNRREDA